MLFLLVDHAVLAACFAWCIYVGACCVEWWHWSSLFSFRQVVFLLLLSILVPIIREKSHHPRSSVTSVLCLWRQTSVLIHLSQLHFLINTNEMYLEIKPMASVVGSGTWLWYGSELLYRSQMGGGERTVVTLIVDYYEGCTIVTLWLQSMWGQERTVSTIVDCPFLTHPLSMSLLKMHLLQMLLLQQAKSVSEMSNHTSQQSA